MINIIMSQKDIFEYYKNEYINIINNMELDFVDVGTMEKRLENSKKKYYHIVAYLLGSLSKAKMELELLRKITDEDSEDFKEKS